MNSDSPNDSIQTEPADTYCASGSICALNRIKAGTAVRIKQLCGNPEISRRLREIGIYEEQIIKLVNSNANIICQICNTRLAISNQVAQAILVEPLFSSANRQAA